MDNPPSVILVEALQVETDGLIQSAIQTAVAATHKHGVIPADGKGGIELEE